MLELSDSALSRASLCFCLHLPCCASLPSSVQIYMLSCIADIDELLNTSISIRLSTHSNYAFSMHAGEAMVVAQALTLLLTDVLLLGACYAAAAYACSRAKPATHSWARFDPW